MIHLQLSLALSYEVNAPGSDFIFNIHAAQTKRQKVVHESLIINQNVPWNVEDDPSTGNRFLRLSAATGLLQVSYTASVELSHHIAEPEQVGEIPVAHLPFQVLRYLYPSRYCQSDRLYLLAMREFGHCQTGYSRVQAICDWVAGRITYVKNTSDSNSSAIDTLIETAGVCRDFAHLMIALCRASNIPARFATGINYGVNLTYDTFDFHAYVEVYLVGGWYLFDPSGIAIPMGLLRLGTGRDAADVAFATIFGEVVSSPPWISIGAIADANGSLVLPQRVPSALSTDDWH
ncbi:transglutaminase family protein [Acidithiobacillus thiooxidans]|uniref:transglutaminase-like domain-containing protein n=1 Tax=Acidithiobacillus thiooxidans TaxID=930 RepID=UPI0028597582|nr:transglutaminase family protein [Acidithiobacillus thiooxidans]MDR7925877.1 transglutaminase family protein [Acidithiobacillus thiooxidans]